MELRHCSDDFHFIQAIKGGLVSKELNITRGRPTLSFKQVTDIYDDERAEPDASVCNANDNRSCDLDDNDLENITLKEFHLRCKTRKRKYSHGVESSKTNNEIDVPSSPENNREKQMSPDDSDFLETLGTLKSKLSKKRKCNENTQENIPVVKSKETHIGQEFAHSCGDSLALVEEPEVPETDCLDHSMKLSNVNDSSSACDGPDYYSGIVAREEADVAHECSLENDNNNNNNNNQALIPLGEECYLENELSHVQEDHDDFVPLQMAWISGEDIVVSNPELTSNQSPNFPATKFASEDCNVLPDVHHISSQAISSVEDHHSNVFDNEPDGDTSISLPNVATPECLDCMDLGYRDGSTFLSDCSENEFTTNAEVHAKTSSTSEHDFNPGGCLVSSSDDSPESMEKLSFSSVHDDEGEHKTEATNELISSNEHCSSDLDHPKGLLSNRKTLSQSSMQLIDTADKDFLKCKEKLYIGEQSGKKKGTASGLDETRRARFVDNPKKVSNSTKTFKGGFHPKGILKFPHRSERDSIGCSSLQSCPYSTSIAFSKRQMHDFETLTMKLTKELKSMKVIVDDMLRSEFCLNTSLRYKVNEATLAVKKAAKTEETANRCLSVLARNCNRFCKLLKLAVDGPDPQPATPKGRGKVSFADEAGGTLCQVRFFKGDQTSLLESITEKESSCNNSSSISEKESSCNNSPPSISKKESSCNNSPPSISEKESSCNNSPSISEKESSCNNSPSISEKESSCNNSPSTSEKEKLLQ